jgi:hypothetical protein
MRCQQPYKRRTPCKLNELGYIGNGRVHFSFLAGFGKVFPTKLIFLFVFIRSIYILSPSLYIFHVYEYFISRRLVEDEGWGEGAGERHL